MLVPAKPQGCPPPPCFEGAEPDSALGWSQLQDGMWVRTPGGVLHPIAMGSPQTTITRGGGGGELV